MLSRILFIVVAVVIAALGTGCMALNSDLAKYTGQAITESEALHCGTAGAPNAPLCLNDGQFKQVNVDLAKVSAAGLAYTQIAAAAAQAKMEPPAAAVVTLLQAFSSAMADIEAVVGLSGEAILNDLKTAVKGL